MMVSTCFQGLLGHSAPTRCAHNHQASRHLQSGEGTGWSGHGSQDCNQRLLQMMLSQSMCHTPVLDQGEFGIFESQKERISFPTSEPHTGHTLGCESLISSSRGGIDSFKTRPLTCTQPKSFQLATHSSFNRGSTSSPSLEGSDIALEKKIVKKLILRERTKSTGVGGHLRHHLEDSEYICTSNHQVLLAQMEEAAGEAEVDHQVKLLLGENSVPMLHPSGGVGGPY